MSDVATGAAGAGGQRLLAPVTAAILLTIGIVSFIAMLVLGAYAPDLAPGGTGGGHALSDAVNGFSGIVRLADATGRRPRIVRNAHLLNTEDLVVATPEAGSVAVDPVLGVRPSTPTLLVLPKWATRADGDHRGWSWIDGLIPVSDPRGVLAPSVALPVIQRRSGGRPLRTVDPDMTGVSFLAPRPLQAIRPATAESRNGSDYGALEPLVVDDRGDIVVGKFANRPLYVLADPDLLDNRGMHDARTAASALAMLDWMNSNQARGIAFDVTLNGFGHGSSPLKLVFQPPFLATTLTLAAAVMLAALGTVARFGSPRPRERAIAFGKAALVANTAMLVRKARRETRLGDRYVDVVRETAARRFAISPRIRGAALDEALDHIDRGARFTRLAAEVATATDRAELVGAARALHDWMEGRGR